eukprot:520240-Lingulodinium_polyedra.AAC.1
MACVRRAICELLQRHGRFDSIIVHGFKNRAECCGQVDRLPPQRRANCTPHALHANATFGVCMERACDLRAA